MSCENKYLYKYLNSQPLLVPYVTNIESYKTRIFLKNNLFSRPCCYLQVNCPTHYTVSKLSKKHI